MNEFFLILKKNIKLKIKIFINYKKIAFELNVNVQ